MPDPDRVLLKVLLVVIMLALIILMVMCVYLGASNAVNPYAAISAFAFSGILGWRLAIKIDKL